MLLSGGVGEDSWESLGLKGDQTSSPKGKPVLNVHWKDWYWSWNSNTLATWCEEVTPWERPWCWERLKAGGEGDDRRWDGWMASPTQRTCIWASSRSWWWTGKPGLLQSMGSQRVRKDWATELKWTGPISNFNFSSFKHPSHPVFTFSFLFPSISWVQCPLFPCLWSFFPSPSSSWPLLLVLCFSHLLFDLCLCLTAASIFHEL